MCLHTSSGVRRKTHAHFAIIKEKYESERRRIFIVVNPHHTSIYRAAMQQTGGIETVKLLEQLQVLYADCVVLCYKARSMRR